MHFASVRKNARALAVFSLITLLLLELTLHFVLLSPRLARCCLPESLADVGRWFYFRARRVPQFEAGLGCYDPDLFYTLCPGTQSTLSNLEFVDEYRVNSKGLRDSEENLSAPEVIVLGDSYAMGMGVPESLTFPRRLARLTGKKVLNAAISSFGTVRELSLLNRLDTSRLRYLVIQYCWNDRNENASYYQNEQRLPIRSRATFDSLVAQQNSPASRFFSLMVLRKIQRVLTHAPPLEETVPTVDASEAALFLNALRHVPHTPLSRVQVVLLEAPLADGFQSKLLPELKEMAHGITLVDVGSKLNSSDYYFYDDHWNAEGHRKVADALAAALASSPQN